MKPDHPINQAVIFSGAMWSQRQIWKRMMQVLPQNSCLLVIDPQNVQQTQVMRQVAQSFRNKGQAVFIWMKPAPYFDKLHSRVD